MPIALVRPRVLVARGHKAAPMRSIVGLIVGYELAFRSDAPALKRGAVGASWIAPQIALADMQATATLPKSRGHISLRPQRRARGIVADGARLADARTGYQ